MTVRSWWVEGSGVVVVTLLGCAGVRGPTPPDAAAVAEGLRARSEIENTLPRWPDTSLGERIARMVAIPAGAEPWRVVVTDRPVPEAVLFADRTVHLSRGALVSLAGPEALQGLFRLAEAAYGTGFRDPETRILEPQPVALHLTEDPRDVESAGEDWVDLLDGLAFGEPARLGAERDGEVFLPGAGLRLRLPEGFSFRFHVGECFGAATDSGRWFRAAHRAPRGEPDAASPGAASPGGPGPHPWPGVPTGDAAPLSGDSGRRALPGASSGNGAPPWDAAPLSGRSERRSLLGVSSWDDAAVGDVAPVTGRSEHRPLPGVWSWEGALPGDAVLVTGRSERGSLPGVWSWEGALPGDAVLVTVRSGRGSLPGVWSWEGALPWDAVPVTDRSERGSLPGVSSWEGALPGDAAPLSGALVRRPSPGVWSWEGALPWDAVPVTDRSERGSLPGVSSWEGALPGDAAPLSGALVRRPSPGVWSWEGALPWDAVPVIGRSERGSLPGVLSGDGAPPGVASLFGVMDGGACPGAAAPALSTRREGSAAAGLHAERALFVRLGRLLESREPVGMMEAIRVRDRLGVRGRLEGDEGGVRGLVALVAVPPGIMHLRLDCGVQLRNCEREFLDVLESIRHLDGVEPPGTLRVVAEVASAPRGRTVRELLDALPESASDVPIEVLHLLNRGFLERRLEPGDRFLLLRRDQPPPKAPAR